jgi:hypothetical protein
MNEQIITQEGLKNLSRVNSSCKVLEKKKIHNLEYLIEKARGEEDIELKEFISGLPQKSVMYQSIADFALELGTVNIGRNAVWKFFGGDRHIQDIIEQIEIYGIEKKNPDFSHKFLFSHVLLPIEIVSVREDEIDAVYRNAGSEVPIKGLFPVVNYVPKRNDHKFRIGDIVFSHQASVVLTDPEPKVAETLLDFQYTNPYFQKSVEYLIKKGGIDYNYFWSLRQWTKDLIGQVVSKNKT